MTSALAHEPLRSTSYDIAPSEVLYVAERSAWGQLGYETVAAAFDSVTTILWSPGEPKPDLGNWQGDWIISFKSDLILPRAILERAKKGAINFHPSPPKYRGLGGYWWAIHNGDDTFGVTCHNMNERIDHGEIITTKSFPIWPGETAESLKHRAAIHSLALLNATLNDILTGKSLAPCGVQWGRHLYTSKELAQAQSSYVTNGNLRHAIPAIEALEAVMKDSTYNPELNRNYAVVRESRVA